MPHLNPYVHTCVDQPRHICPGCKWAEEQQAVDTLVHALMNTEPSIPTRDALKIFLKIAALFLLGFIVLPWVLGLR